MHQNPAATSDGPLDPFAMKTIPLGQNLPPGDPWQRGQEVSPKAQTSKCGRRAAGGESQPLTPGRELVQRRNKRKNKPREDVWTHTWPNVVLYPQRELETCYSTNNNKIYNKRLFRVSPHSQHPYPLLLNSSTTTKPGERKLRSFPSAGKAEC